MLLHTDTFTHRRFYTQGTFTHRHFYTQALLHTDSFTHRRFCTQLLLHRRFYTQSFYPQKLLQTEAFTHRRFYTDAFTHRHFYTQTLLHTDTFNTDPFTHRPAHVHALTLKSSLSWPLQQFDGGVKFVPCIRWTCIQYSTGYRSIAQTALVAITSSKVENQIAKLLTKVLSQAKNRPGPPPGWRNHPIPSKYYRSGP